MLYKFRKENYCDISNSELYIDREVHFEKIKSNKKGTKGTYTFSCPDTEKVCFTKTGSKLHYLRQLLTKQYVKKATGQRKKLNASQLTVSDPSPINYAVMVVDIAC